MFDSLRTHATILGRLAPIAFLAAGIACLHGQAARAADSYVVDPTLTALPSVPSPDASGLTVQAIGSETGSTESNPLMLTHGEKSLTGSTTSPELIINDQTPTDRIDADTRVDENLFNQSSFDSTDVHSNIGLTTQNQRWMAGVQEKTDYDTTRTSELTTYDISATPVRHLGLSLAPQLSFSPTATDKFSILGSAADSTYGNSTYSNYEVFSVTPSYAHDFDPRNAGIFQIQAQNYKTTDGIANTVDTIGPSIGWVTALTPRLSAKATIGMQVSREYTENISSQSWRPDFIYSADISFKGEQNTADLVSSRAEYPSGNGTESLLTGISVSETHTLNPRFSVNVGASYQSGQYLGDTVGSLDSLWGGNAGVTYHAMDEVDVKANYQYRYETLTSTSGEAQDHIFTIGIVYHPKTWAL